MPTRSTRCAPGDRGEMDVPSTPPALQATSTLPAWSVMSTPSTLMRTEVTPACAQVSPPKVQSREIDPPGTLCTSIWKTLSPRCTVMSCCVWYRIAPFASSPEMVKVYVPAKKVPSGAAPPAMAPPPRSQENWLGLSSSCAMSIWMVWTPAARHDWPPNVQFTRMVPRAGSPHPDPSAATAARPANAVNGARMFPDHPPARLTCGRAFLIQTDGPAAPHPGHGNRTRRPHVSSEVVRFGIGC